MHSTWSMRRRKAELHPAKCHHPVVHDRYNGFSHDRARVRDRSPSCAQLPHASTRDRSALKARKVADPSAARRVRTYLDLQVRSKPHRAALAVDHLGQRVCCRRMARRIGRVLMVRGEFRQLQQDLRLAWRGHRVYDLDMAVDNCRSSRRQAQCRNRGPTAPSG
jgi:hypothetical protein